MLNSVTIVGRLGRDPEIRKLPSGSSVASFSLATTETWKDRHSGEKKERTEWHRCAVFADKLAEAVGKYAHKGDMLLVQGKLQTRKWKSNSGEDRYTTEVVVDFNGVIRFLTPKGESGGASEAGDSQTGDYVGDGSSGALDIDDEIPF